MKNLIVLCFFALILSVTFTQAAELSIVKNSYIPSWPFEQSDLTPDPSLLRGTLYNGLRYVIKNNLEPAERVAIYLDVQAGSLHENEEQRGVAHFLEHLMFNGSTNFPPGSLVDYFQSVGMSFGGDTNAHTAYDETVYRIFLPNGSPQKIDKMLLVMADYASGALLLDSEIDRERGIILSEKRSRDSASYRAHVARSAFAFRGTRYPERLPIGTLKVLENADHSLLKSYYDAWYRPNNMILVIVGDIDPLKVKGLVKEKFSKLQVSEGYTEVPEFGSLEHKGLETFYHYEPDLGKTNVSIETLWDKPIILDSLELEKKELIRYMGTMIVRYRLQRLQEKEKQPFSHATYYSGDIVSRIGYGMISAQTSDKDWKDSLALLDRTLREAITFGFESNELDRVKKEIISSLDAGVLTAKTEDSRRIAVKIIDHLNNNRVYQSPEQEKELYTPIVKNISIEAVNREFRDVWKHNSRLVSVTGNTQLGDDGNTSVLNTYKNTQTEKVLKGGGLEKTIFPYLTVSEPLDLTVQSEIDKEIEVERVVFKNGLIVNLKKTQFQENSFQVLAGFGNGELSEPVPGMALLAERVVNRSGSGKLTMSDIKSTIAGSSVDMHFRVGKSVNYWKGSALTKDFDLFVQILHTMMIDVGLRENVFDTVMANVKLMYQKKGREIEGAIPLEIQPFLAGNNPRFGLPPWEVISEISYSELADWVSSVFQISNLEISIAGDFDRDEVIKKLGKYFGDIKLAGLQKPNISKVNFPIGKNLTVEVNTSIEKSLITIAWPTDDYWDISRTRRLNLLANIFQDRLRKVVREKQGATYSPSVSNSNSRVYDGYGFMIAKLTVKPGTEDAVCDEILRISTLLRDEGVTPEELARAQKPVLASINDSVKTNNYWLNSVLFLSSRYPQQLEWAKDLISDYSSINEKELNLLAKKYFQRTKVAKVKVISKNR